MNVMTGSVHLTVFTGPDTAVTLNYVTRYTNWFSKAISWFFGRSVDVQYGNKIERVNIGDITSKIYAKVKESRPGNNVASMQQIERDIKLLTDNCAEPLTQEVLNCYASRLATEPKVENDAVVLDVLKALAREKIETNMQSTTVEEGVATLHCALKYIDQHRKSDKFASLQTALQAIQPNMPNVQKHYIPPLFGRTAKQHIVMENETLLTRILRGE